MAEPRRVQGASAAGEGAGAGANFGLFGYSSSGALSRSPRSALLPLVGRVPLVKLTTERSWYPYSNLTTGGPSCCPVSGDGSLLIFPHCHLGSA